MTIRNNGTIVTPANGYDDINDRVIGHGTYVVSAGATLDFLHGVGSGQDIELSNKHPGNVYSASSLVIDDPADFHGQVDLTYVAPPRNATAAITEQSNIGIPMVGKTWDSYSFRNDMLRLWSGNTVAEQFSLTVHDPYGITVQAAPGGWAFVSANTADTRGINFLTYLHPPAMPVHV